MGCAECHDHKFDPFLTKDFYAMKAFFADVKETGFMPDRGPTAWGEQLSLPSEEQQKQRADLEAKLTAAHAKLDEKAAALAANREAWERDLKAALGGRETRVDLAASHRRHGPARRQVDHLRR